MEGGVSTLDAVKSAIKAYAAKMDAANTVSELTEAQLWFMSVVTPETLGLLADVVAASSKLDEYSFAHSEWATCQICDGFPVYDAERQFVTFAHKPDCAAGELFEALRRLA